VALPLRGKRTIVGLGAFESGKADLGSNRAHLHGFGRRLNTFSSTRGVIVALLDLVESSAGNDSLDRGDAYARAEAEGR
jgi:hypothetical protein